MPAIRDRSARVKDKAYKPLIVNSIELNLFYLFIYLTFFTFSSLACELYVDIYNIRVTTARPY